MHNIFLIFAVLGGDGVLQEGQNEWEARPRLL
jgi:hypothetical protein